VDKIISRGSEFRSAEIADHAQIGGEDQNWIPPPGEVQFWEQEYGKTEHKCFFNFH